MIISDFYQTKIEASSYNVNIDSTDTVITVSLIDFNGAAVTGKSVTLTVDRGYFNKNGSTAISGTTTKSITATTDGNGKITATYTASEWGLATFSTNTANTQINVKGWRQVHTNNDSVYIVKYNENIVSASLNLTGGVNYTANTVHSIASDILIDKERGNIDLRPRLPIYQMNPDFGRLVWIRDNDYKVFFKASANLSNQSLYVNFTYARK